MNGLGRVGRRASDVVILAVIGFAAVLLTGRASMEPVLSGSMSGYADRGDLILATNVDPGSVKIGDVIMFAPPAPWTPPGGHPVAHRVVRLQIRDGSAVALTKGDANSTQDPWTLDLTHTRIATVRAVVPALGWPFIRLSSMASPLIRIMLGAALITLGAALGTLGRGHCTKYLTPNEYYDAAGPARSRKDAGT